MDSLKKNNLTLETSETTCESCTDPSCFFCCIKQQDLSLRRGGIASCFRKMPLKETEENVMVLSGLWNIAMTQPDDPEFPSLGVFNCMAKMILKGTNDTDWLLEDQNIYIPYYAAHVIGSYTMNKVEFAEKAIESGVIPPLIELLRGKISWVEQRVAVRALGHLASYEKTFESVALYEKEIVKLTTELASTCLDTVYASFVGVKDGNKRLKYHSDLLTRGVGGVEMQNRKAEEWASQLQCWSIYLLNCFAIKERTLNLICRQEFLKDLCGMWGGLVNHSSPAGVGLVRILCYSKNGRKFIAESEQIINNLCNLSRSSDDWQYIGIDCLLLLLKDQDTRYKVIEIATLFLADLVELRNLGDKFNVGKKITTILLLDYKKSKSKNIKSQKVQKALQEIRDFHIERRKREKLILSEEEIENSRVLVALIKQQGNRMFWSGDIEEALEKYNEALNVCPLRLRKERMILYSNRGQCNLLLNKPDSAISDSTRALCLSNPANSHSKSLWRRSQAYDMKGLAKESLMDCIMFLNCSINTEPSARVKIPYSAARMISKQMDATWIFADSQLKMSSNQAQKMDGDYDMQKYEEMMRRTVREKESFMAAGLSTIMEEPIIRKEMRERKNIGGARRGKNGV